MMARVLDVNAQQMCRDLENERLSEVYVDDPQVFAADEILDIRAISTEIEYCVKWTGYSAEYNEWVAEKHVTPDLKREFSKGKKKTLLLLKHEKVKARVMRKKHGKIAKSSNLALTSTPFAVPLISRIAGVRVNTIPTEYDKENGTSLSVTMSVKYDPQISKWTTPKKGSVESDAAMSETSSECDESELEVTKWTTPNEGKVGCHASMSTASSKSGESELKVPKWTAAQKDNVGCDTLMSTASSGESEGCDETMFETSSCDESELEVPKWTAPKQDNEESGASTSVVPLEFDESGFEEKDQNAVRNGNEENGPLVFATLPNEFSTKTTRRESDQSSVVSMTLVAESESDADSFPKKYEPEESILGVDEHLQPLYTFI
ncbi:hypothetical protein HA402_003156 [Bradysia odoriphaga]|nr:hypothetical protein HA402_003156 [Bradysia odoriphaga]